MCGPRHDKNLGPCPPSLHHPLPPNSILNLTQPNPNPNPKPWPPIRIVPIPPSPVTTHVRAICGIHHECSKEKKMMAPAGDWTGPGPCFTRALPVRGWGGRGVPRLRGQGGLRISRRHRTTLRRGEAGGGLGRHRGGPHRRPATCRALNCYAVCGKPKITARGSKTWLDGLKSNAIGTPFENGATVGEFPFRPNRDHAVFHVKGK